MLYAYKSVAGAIFGGDYKELNGNITFALTGSMFAKGTKQGATIGSGGKIDTNVSYTPNNWVANDDSCLYLYLTGIQRHALSCNLCFIYYGIFRANFRLLNL